MFFPCSRRRTVFIPNHRKLTRSKAPAREGGRVDISMTSSVKSQPSSQKASWNLRELTKAFPGVIANDNVSIRLDSGEIHGLVGENGSGKSTLIKMLMGVYQPDTGRILRNNEPVSITDPITARALGIATVFQEFSLVPTLTVAENIYLGRLPKFGPRVDWAAISGGARQALSRLNVRIDPEAIVGDLSVAGQQLVEIAKALAAEASLIILDEPTTALGLDEIAELHRILRGLRDRGAAILYVSHRLDEVIELADCVTVLKDGRIVSAAHAGPVTIEAIVGAMIGQVEEHYPKSINVGDQIALALDHVKTANRVNGASFTVKRGEVFGLGGVMGSGRTEIARAIFGVDRLTAGQILLDGRPMQFRSPHDAVRAGIALVPENRKYDGLFFNFAGKENITIARLDRLARAGMLDLRQETIISRDLIDKLSITPGAEETLVGLLSGGNQQKIVIARWLFASADIFVLDEPTQGIDVGAKIAVYGLINELTAAGKSVILISSDYDELLAMSDRVGIVSHGRIVAIEPAQALLKTDLVRASARQRRIDGALAA
jgi:ribose transport system ATP-binding protein